MDIWSVSRVADHLEEMDIAIDREAMSLARWIWREILGFGAHSEIELTNEQHQHLADTFQRLLNGEPAQYIAGHAWFYGIKFKVSKDVLIPRPETEELVEWIIADYRKTKKEKIQILDIGTGSGCIAILLKKQLGEKASVIAIDISDRALEIAAFNSRVHQVEVDFRQQDFLLSGFAGLGTFDIIVSNPPYVSKELAGHEITQKLKYEPEVALYPLGADPDIFYKKISNEGLAVLREGGNGYLELNEFRAQDIEDYFRRRHWGNVEMRIDMQGMPRMLKVQKPFITLEAAEGRQSVS